MADRKLSRRQFLKAAGLAFCGAALGGCAEKLRLNLPLHRELFQLKIMASEEALPDNQLEYFRETFGGSEIIRLAPERASMMEMVAAGQELDIFFTRADKFPWMARTGLCQDITEYITESTHIRLESLFPVIELCKWDNQWYGLVLDWSPDFLVWVNRRLWEESGVPFSWGKNPYIHLSEWRSLSARLSQKDSAGEVIGTDFEIDLLGLLWLASTADPSVQVFTPDGSRVILATQPAFIELVRWIEDWKREGGLPVMFTSLKIQSIASCACMNEIQQDTPTTLRPFISGSSSAQDWLQNQAVATFQGVGFGSKIMKSRVGEKDILVLPAPRYGPKEVNPTTKADAMGISTACRQTGTAWLFLEWYGSGEPARERTRQGVGLPINRDYLPLFPQQTPWQKQLYETCIYELEKSKRVSIPLSAYFNPEWMQDLWNQQEETYLLGHKTLEDFLVDFEDLVNQSAEA